MGTHKVKQFNFIGKLPEKVILRLHTYYEQK